MLYFATAAGSPIASKETRRGTRYRTPDERRSESHLSHMAHHNFFVSDYDQSSRLRRHGLPAWQWCTAFWGFSELWTRCNRIGRPHWYDRPSRLL